MDEEALRLWRRALAVCLACVAGLAAVYAMAVWTTPGQRFEDAVLRAADSVAGTDERAQALRTLDIISVPSVVAGIAVTMLIALLRRRLFLGFVSVGMVAVSIAATEAFQRLAPRPILLSQGLRREDQSFPGGHATVAMALMCAVVLVAPARLRGPVVALSSLGAAGVGVATVTASWHRPSDTIGADLIVAGCACAAIAVLARCGRVREASPTRMGRLLPGLLVWAYATAAVVAFAVAAVAVGGVLTASGGGDSGAATLLAGRSLALSGSAAVAVTLLVLLRHVDLGAPTADPPDEGSPDAESGHAGVHRPSGP